MTTATPYLSLILYNSSSDQAATFATFRAAWGGTATTSNFYKIDTFASSINTRVTTLETTPPPINVPSTFSSSNYYIATGITSITAYNTGMTIILSVDTTSSGTVTLNINSLGIKSVMKVDSSGTAVNLTGSDLVKGRKYLFQYDGTRWLWVSANSADQIQIVGTSGNVVTVGSTNELVGTTTPSNLISGTIHSATTKATPVDADELGISDSEDSNLLKKLTWANLKATLNSVYSWATVTHAATSKTTPADADELSIADSAASYVIKKLTFSNLKATLKSYFDPLYGQSSLFGDGNDGDVTISSTVSLTRDMYYNNLTVDATGILKPSGFKISVRGTLLINSGGVIESNGTNGTNSSGTGGGAGGASPYSAGTLPAPASGGNGGTFVSNVASVGGSTKAGAVSSSLVASSLKVGGSGGGGGGGNSAGASVADTCLATAGTGGTGATSFTGTGGYSGGGGASGGGCILIYANTINNGGSIFAKGGTGGNGWESLSATGGGGGGGGGGSITIFYRTLAGSGLGTRNVDGGNPGNGGVSSTAGTSGVSVSYAI